MAVRALLAASLSLTLVIVGCDDFGRYLYVRNDSPHTIYVRSGATNERDVLVVKAHEFGGGGFTPQGDTLTVLDEHCGELAKTTVPAFSAYVLTFAASGALSVIDFTNGAGAPSQIQQLSTSSQCSAAT